MEGDKATQDQMIMAQKEALDKEIAANVPLIGQKQDIKKLEEELKNDEKFWEKAHCLGNDYAFIRRTRPDGNCFYRSLAFRYFEILLDNKEEFKRFRDKVAPSKDEMVKLGFPQFTVEDFYDNFMNIIDKIAENDFNQEKLHEIFNDQGSSDYIVVFLRLITSMHLQKNAEFFKDFLEEGKSIKDFCSTDVEPMYTESDNIHITALTTATGIHARVMYLDRGTNKEASPHDFPEDSEPKVHLLYRPGHYDILYAK